jgi:hypothetical protein
MGRSHQKNGFVFHRQYINVLIAVAYHFCHVYYVVIQYPRIGIRSQRLLPENVIWHIVMI